MGYRTPCLLFFFSYKNQLQAFSQCPHCAPHCDDGTNYHSKSATKRRRITTGGKEMV